MIRGKGAIDRLNRGARRYFDYRRSRTSVNVRDVARPSSISVKTPAAAPADLAPKRLADDPTLARRPSIFEANSRPGRLHGTSPGRGDLKRSG